MAPFCIRPILVGDILKGYLKILKGIFHKDILLLLFMRL